MLMDEDLGVLLHQSLCCALMKKHFLDTFWVLNLLHIKGG